MRDTAITANRPPAPPPPVPAAPQRRSSPKHPLYQALEVVASLRITVVLFSLALILVFYGTWAQMEMGTWTAVETYFRSYLVWIPLRVILCYAFPEIPGAIPYPGGWLLGFLLLVNLLAAHAIHFKLSWKRSGILLTHAGIVLMMLGEWVTGTFAVEGYMRIKQGASANFLEHDRHAELAIIDSSDLKKDLVVVIPDGRLRRGGSIADDRLTFIVEINQYMVNSVLLDPEEGKENPATAGIGLKMLAAPRTEVSGTAAKQAPDNPSAYLTFKRKDNGQRLGTYLVSFYSGVPQKVTLDDKTYHVHLRLKRSYKPFTLHLLEFRHDKYLGTSTAKNYSSLVRLVDPTTGENRTVKISMNDPLRYRGETFYQADFLRNEVGTILQVVRNPGWLLPYISCVMVVLGMLIHFCWVHLAKFIREMGA